VSFPVVNEPAGTPIFALPLLSATAAELKLPEVSVTDPVGVGLPLPPPTAIVTVNAWVVVMLDADGVTTTVGVVFGGRLTVTKFDPDALL